MVEHYPHTPKNMRDWRAGAAKARADKLRKDRMKNRGKTYSNGGYKRNLTPHDIAVDRRNGRKAEGS